MKADLSYSGLTLNHYIKTLPSSCSHPKQRSSENHFQTTFS
ncbi:hypothetical protein HMPREF9418_1359 [Neisseria macacae ATCC 33926]|uniref:Uncharacterized protein n=1 Tax=Neisseria macacae ATCC 33926 TaxID=997348 RepID=A0AA36UJG5_9NEIS|nr:hypothetical protein HMPREF9418_1359 [Neisseria macacae ATCC 33926]